MNEHVEIAPPKTRRSKNGPSLNARTVEQLIEFVREAWGDSVESIIKVGRRLETAKEEAGHGQWMKVLAGLHLSPSHAAMYMRIADCENIANLHDYANLPNVLNTLDQFRHLSAEIFEAAIADGRINPGMKTKDAKALAGIEPKARSSASSSKVRVADRCAMIVRETILKAVNEIEPEEWDGLIADLRSELADIEAIIEERRQGGEQQNG